jgi:hypothetical protein
MLIRYAGSGRFGHSELGMARRTCNAASGKVLIAGDVLAAMNTCELDLIHGVVVDVSLTAVAIALYAAFEP